MLWHESAPQAKMKSSQRSVFQSHFPSSLVLQVLFNFQSSQYAFRGGDRHTQREACRKTFSLIARDHRLIGVGHIGAHLYPGCEFGDATQRQAGNPPCPESGAAVLDEAYADTEGGEAQAMSIPEP